MGYGLEKDSLQVGIVSPLDIEYIESESFKNSLVLPVGFPIGSPIGFTGRFIKKFF